MRIATVGLLFIALLGGVSSSPIEAQCSSEGWQQSLRHNLSRQGISSTTVLATTHKTGDWSAWSWNGTSLAPLPEVKTQPDGSAKLTLDLDSDGTPFQVFVVDTNPLVYATKLAAAADSPTEDRAQLEKFLQLVGNLLGSISASTGFSGFSSFALQKSLLESAPSRIANLQYETDETTFDWTKAQSLWPARDDAHPDLIARLGDLSESLEEYKPHVEDLHEALEDVPDLLVRVRDLGKSVPLDTNARKQFLQLVELKAWKPGDAIPYGPTGDEPIRQAVKELTEAEGRVVAVPLPCIESLGRLGQLMDLALLPSAPDPDAVDKTFSGLLSKLTSDSCDEADLEERIRNVALWFGMPGQGPTPPGRINTPIGTTILTFQQEALRPLNKDLAKKGESVAGISAGLKAASGLISDATVNEILSDKLHELIGNARGRTIAADLLNHGVVRVVRPEHPVIKLKRGNRRTEEFSISSISLLKAGITLDDETHPTAGKRSYQVMRKGGFFKVSYDFALIAYSDVDAPSFDELEVKVDGETKDVIAQADQESKNGSLALFASFMPRSREKKFINGGFQFGLGIDTSDPSAFAGLVLGLGKYVRISGGWSIFQVDELRSGFELGSDVPAVGNYQREGYDDGAYIALSVTLNEIPLFKSN